MPRVLAVCGLLALSGSLSAGDVAALVTRAENTPRKNEESQPPRCVRDRAGEVVVAITKGKLDFGPWEQIFYGEFDGHRPKRVLVKVIGE